MATVIYNPNIVFTLKDTPDLPSFMVERISLVLLKSKDNIKNALSKTKDGYSTQDVIAYLKGKGVSTDLIAGALRLVQPQYTTETVNGNTVEAYNRQYDSRVNYIADFINEKRPEANAFITTKINDKGAKEHTLYYKDVNGDSIGVTFDPTHISEFAYKNGELNIAKRNAFINSHASITEAISGVKGKTNLSTDTSKDNVAGNANSNSSGNISGSSSGGYVEKPKQILPTNQTLTDADIKNLKTNTPNIADYAGLDIGKNSNVSKNLFNDLDTNTKLDTIQRTGLNDLLDDAESFNKALTDRTTQSIDNQQQRLIQQIKNDPELYNTVMSQLRQDTAEGTIAGQRAANVVAQAAATGATYDKESEELFQALLGENNVATNVRDSIYGSKTAALDSYIKGRLNQASSDAYQKQTQANELIQLLSLLGEASGVAQTQYENDVARATAEADVKADRKDVTTTGTAGGLKASDYTVSKTQNKVDVANLTNKQYNDIVNNPIAKQLLTDAAFKQHTAGKSYADILKEYGLTDVLGTGEDDTQLYEVYKGFVEEANQESNKTFNQAQKAYIASIAAGDSVTAEQLTKLAQTAGNTKGNLYAASTLANQYTQQRNAANTGLNLRDSFQQQIADNKMAESNIKTNANNAFTGYVGNGYDASGSATLSGVKKIFDDASTTAKGGYSNWAQTFMNNTKEADRTLANAKLNDFIRINNLANKITNKNISGAINNKS